MAQTNGERVGKALEVLRDTLKPYIASECERVYGERWRYTVASRLRNDRMADDLDDPMDVSVHLTIMWECYNDVFKSRLGYPPRSYVSELREVRNNWAHQQSFTTNDTYRALDNAERLLRAIGAVAQADEIEAQVQELMRVRYEESARKVVRRATTRPLDSTATGGLHPWREIVMPHVDVSTGRYLLAEFTADLWQVAIAQSASTEYSDPSAFFQRTYLTQGLHDLLRNALMRLSGIGGEPVMELQTNFGGGKTHSMLALYHLFSGQPAQSLFGIEGLLSEMKLSATFPARRAVLAGQKIAPGQPSHKPDGTIVRTLWGELAWQLGGAESYALVAESDATGTNPGDNIRFVLERAQPCLILIDEWVAYARQLYDKSGLPAGDFEANISFAQALSEAVAHVPRALLVVSLPTSETEVGGSGGKETLDRLKQVFNRIQSPWRPASTEEGYEIVRRRLFQPLDGANALYRDAVLRAYSELYQHEDKEFPPECHEERYRRRMESTYPFHPELFDRLYNDWCQLDRFQQTRGVLRLLATVIHALWDREDRSLLIMPASIPIDDDNVQNNLTYYLDPPWRPIIENDIIGLSQTIDDGLPNLKKIHATRRVGRTLFMGSAPVPDVKFPGLTDKQIKLGCVQPGEPTAIIGDALRHLRDRANYLYYDTERNWYTTQPSVTRLASDRAMQYDIDKVYEEIRTRLRKEGANRGHFARVHICPASSADVPDERDARLVILDPRHAYLSGNESDALTEVKEIQDHRGTAIRYKKNTLVYLAPDKSNLDGLLEIVRQHLAWKSILADHEVLNLDAFQKRTAETRIAETEKAIKTRINATYVWLLYPKIPKEKISEFLADRGKDPWLRERLTATDEIVSRASKYLTSRQDLTTAFGHVLLRMALDGLPSLWREDHVRVEQLVDDFATYLYLDRLQTPTVLLDTIREGMQELRVDWESERFAYAESYDAAQERYRGLRIPGESGTVTLDSNAVLVKPIVALAQRQREEAERAAHATPHSNYSTSSTAGGSALHEGASSPLAASASSVGTSAQPSTLAQPSGPHISVLRRFHGSVELSRNRAGRDVSTISEEIIAHLEKLPNARIMLTLEIEVDIPDGTPEQVVRTVLENARTLKFREGNYGFEEV